jgi:transcriptional regulator with XRE-family HTH domain
METAAAAQLRLSERLRSLRLERSFSLDTLAEASGISRATLSRIENGEVSPTAQNLGRLCAAYGLSVSRLMYLAEDHAPAKLPPSEQPVWRDDSSGFTRRSVSPPANGFQGEVLRCDLAPGSHITYDHPPRDGLEQHIYILSGRLSFSLAGAEYSLAEGDSLRVKLYGPTAFRTPLDAGAAYLVFLL